MSKIIIPRISFLETIRIITLPPPKSNRKAKIELRACGEQEGRTCTTRRTSRTMDSRNRLWASLIAIDYLRYGKKTNPAISKKPIPHSRSTNPKAKRKAPIRRPSYFLRRLHKIFRNKISVISADILRRVPCLFYGCRLLQPVYQGRLQRLLDLHPATCGIYPTLKAA